MFWYFMLVLLGVLKNFLYITRESMLARARCVPLKEHLVSPPSSWRAYRSQSPSGWKWNNSWTQRHCYNKSKLKTSRYSLIITEINKWNKINQKKISNNLAKYLPEHFSEICEEEHNWAVLLGRVLWQPLLDHVQGNGLLKSSW